MEWKTNDSNNAEQQSLQRQLAKMTNDEIAEVLFIHICNDETNKFKQCLKAIKMKSTYIIF